MKKRITALFLVLALAALALTGCGGSSGGTSAGDAAQSAAGSQTDSAASSGDLFHLRVAYSPSLCQAPLHVAVEKGFFADEGIDPENIQVEAAHVQEAIGADQVDVGFGLIGKFLQPVENGLAIKFTAGIHTGCVRLLAPKDKGIDKLEDLKGKKIGVTGLAGAETITTKRALASVGISFDEQNPEVEFLVFAGSDLGQALENGSVDAIACPDPTAALYQDQYDLNALVDTATTEGYRDEYCCASFVSAKLAKEHPDIAAAYTRAVLKAAVYVNEHPEEAAQIQLDKKYVTGDLDFNVSVLKSYNYIPSVQGGYDAIRLSAEQLAGIGILKADTDPQKFTDDVYLFFDDVPDSYTAADIAAYE